MSDRTGARTRLAVLRRRIAAIEGRPVHLLDAGALDACPSPPAGAAVQVFRDQADRATGPLADRCSRRLPFGLKPVDRALGGGLAIGAVHEIRVGESRHGGLATGFTAALLARLVARRAGLVLWAHDRPGPLEIGHLYAPGLARFGLDPERLLMVAGRRAEDVLWAMEEGLACRGIAAVIGDFFGQPRALDLTAMRRLGLRARSGNRLAVLLRTGTGIMPSVAETRWRIGPHGAGVMHRFQAGIGRPAWRLDLEKNRAGRTGTWPVEWHHDTHSFAFAAHSQPVAAAVDHRPHRPAPMGTVVAFG